MSYNSDHEGLELLIADYSEAGASAIGQTWGPIGGQGSERRTWSILI